MPTHSTRTFRKVVFIDATDAMARVVDALMVAIDGALKHDLTLDLELDINVDPDISPQDIPQRVGDAEVIWVDHSLLPTEIAKLCPKLKHVVFMGTGARSYMNIEALAELGIQVHLIKNYGDTAVAECAFGLMWAGARNLTFMDRAMRQGQWLRSEGVQLTGKTVGLVGFGGIGAEMARLCLGADMKVVAWNRSPRTYPGVTFLPLEELLAQSDVISLHLLLDDSTKGFMSSKRLQQMKPGVMLVNTARGALVDEKALIEQLKSGHIRHAGLDVFTVEPLPSDHPLTKLDNVTLSAHSAFRVPEANQRLVELAIHVTTLIFMSKNQ
jgi:D-3-phosphoglycerate dehydrogenase / 2-oxoglutarate reductase